VEDHNRTVAEEKTRLRAEVRSRRYALPPAVLKRWSGLACRRLQTLEWIRRAGRVGCYCSMPGEVDTADFLSWCWSSGKRVCVPAWNDAGGSYEWKYLGPEDRLQRGPWGVPEPAGTERCPGPELELVVVPGMAFDLEGRRLGHGGGHFDRLLAETAGVRVGLAFEFQVFRRIPAEAHDRRVEAVVTESRVIFCRGETEQTENAEAWH